MECGDDIDVELPPRLVEDCHAGRLVLFVGSGASTESHNVMPSTFYDIVANQVPDSDGLSFPDLMTKFVELNSRSDLINLFYHRMRYIDSFPALGERATRFHRYVGQIPFFREIITTNWDDYFERWADAVPLVHGPDFDYWDLAQRKVLKIHGSVLNPGTIIATRSEYDASLEALAKHALGGAVRHLIATRSVVFIGYSLRDDDIKAVIDVLRADLGTAARRSYFVHPSERFVPPIDGAEVVHTSAAWFVKLLDDALVSAEYLLPTSMYVRLELLDRRLREARTRSDERLPPWEFPLAVYNHSFQDGFADALAHTRAVRKSGTDRRHGDMVQRARNYFELTTEARRKRNYYDAAYYTGYEVGLFTIAVDKVPLNKVPVYYCPGIDAVSNFKKVSEAIRGGPMTHKTAYRWAEKIDRPVGFYSVHRPFL
jgi:SIR2-like domain